MPRARTLLGATLLTWFGASVSVAHDRRAAANHLSPTDRVLLVGTRPEDEDNALSAWLSHGRHVETACLTLTLTRVESAMTRTSTLPGPSTSAQCTLIRSSNASGRTNRSSLT